MWNRTDTTGNLDVYSRAHINCGLLTPELLYDIVKVTDQDEPAGPSFMHVISSLVEACVLHEHLYLVPHEIFRGSGLQGYGILGDAIENSRFAQALINEGVLQNLGAQGLPLDPIPDAQEIVDYIIKHAGFVEYDYYDFFSQVQLAGVSFAYQQPEVEVYKNLADLTTIDGIFSVREGAFEEARRLQEPGPVEETAVQLARARRFTTADIQAIAGCNYRARACENLASAMNMTLYTSFTSLPHFVSTLRERFSFSRELLQRVYTEVTHIDETEQPGIHIRSISPLAQLALEQAKGDRRAIASAILECRHKHSSLRKTITGYEEAWFGAKTRKERLGLRRDFDNAWKTLMERENRPKKRWVQVVWDIVKKHAEIPIEALDQLLKRDVERQVVDRVKGLRAFWDEIENSPVPEEVQRLLHNMFTVNQDQRLWKYFEAVSLKLKQDLKADFVGE